MIISKPMEQIAVRHSDPHVRALVSTSLCMGEGTPNDECVLLGDTSESTDPADPEFGNYTRGIVVIPLSNIATREPLMAVMEAMPNDAWRRISNAIIEESNPVYFRLTIFTAISRLKNSSCVVSGKAFTAHIYLEHTSEPTKHPGFVRHCPFDPSVQRLQAIQSKEMRAVYIIPGMYISAPVDLTRAVVRSTLGADFLPPHCSVCDSDGVHILVPGPSVKYEHVADPNAMACLDPEKGHRLHDNELFDALGHSYAYSGEPNYAGDSESILDTSEHLTAFLGSI